jgi:hypothetical protein
MAEKAELTASELDTLDWLIWLGHQNGPDFFDHPQRFGVSDRTAASFRLNARVYETARRIVGHLSVSASMSACRSAILPSVRRSMHARCLENVPGRLQ